MFFPFFFFSLFVVLQNFFSSSSCMPLYPFLYQSSNLSLHSPLLQPSYYNPCPFSFKYCSVVQSLPSSSYLSSHPSFCPSPRPRLPFPTCQPFPYRLFSPIHLLTQTALLTHSFTLIPLLLVWLLFLFILPSFAKTRSFHLPSLLSALQRAPLLVSFYLSLFSSSLSLFGTSCLW